MKRLFSKDKTKTAVVETNKPLEEYMMETFGVAATPAEELPDEEPALEVVFEVGEKRNV